MEAVAGLVATEMVAAGAAAREAEGSAAAVAQVVAEKVVEAANCYSPALTTRLCTYTKSNYPAGLLENHWDLEEIHQFRDCLPILV